MKNSNINNLLGFTMLFIVSVLSILDEGSDTFPFNLVSNWSKTNWDLGVLTIYPVQWVLTIWGGALLGYWAILLTEIIGNSWKNSSRRYVSTYWMVLGALSATYIYLASATSAPIFSEWWLLAIGGLFTIPFGELFSMVSDTKQEPPIAVPIKDEDTDVEKPMPPVEENKDLQSYIVQAEKSRNNIDALINSSTNQTSHNRSPKLSHQLGELTDAVKEMTQFIAKFRQNSEIHQGLETLPGRIKEMGKKLTHITNKRIRIREEQTLANHKNQFARLKQVEDNARLADAEIRNALSTMEAIYSQILLDQSNRQVTNYDDLLDDVSEQVHVLQDHLEAWEEVVLDEINIQDNDDDNQSNYQATDYTRLAEDTNEEDIQREDLDDEEDASNKAA